MNLRALRIIRVQRGLQAERHGEKKKKPSDPDNNNGLVHNGHKIRLNAFANGTLAWAPMHAPVQRCVFWTRGHPKFREIPIAMCYPKGVLF